MKVSVLDVGQGDALLIQTPERKTVLIDAGIGSVVMGPLGEKMGFFDKTIDLFILTHPDRDHFGGILDVMGSYTIKKALLSGIADNDSYYQEFLTKLREQKVEVLFAHADTDVQIGPRLFLDVLNPGKEDNDVGKILNDKNETSVVTRLIRQTEKGWEPLALFTGDAPIKTEREILIDGEDVRVPILKLGHHGSKYSTSPEWVAATQPRTALISVGKDNKYGHPNQEALDRLPGVQIRRTDEEGTITYEF